MKTLLLDISTWDLVLDLDNNIAVASDPYSMAQDAASAIRTVQGEAYYDVTVGVPYGKILGQLPPIAYLRAKFNAAAETVPGVATSKCFITGLVDRRVSGQVQITSESGQTAAATF